MRTTVWSIALLAGLRGIMGGQLPAVRSLGAPVASSARDAFGAITGPVRVLSDGRVMVNDAKSKRIVLLDPALSSVTVLLSDTSSGTRLYPVRAPLIARYLGDSTLLLDANAPAFLVIDPSGRVDHVAAVPRIADLQSIAPSTFAVDPMGRLIYRMNQSRSGRGGNMPAGPDSAFVLRVDFDNRGVDTVARVKVTPIPPQIGVLGADGKRHISTVVPVFDSSDDWAVFADGAVATLRSRDFHIDWLETDGRRHSTPAPQWPWKRLTDEDKQALVDSAVRRAREMDSVNNASNTASTAPPAVQQRIYETKVVAPSEVPDYHPPFLSHTARADMDNRVWVREATELFGIGDVYDIIDRTGKIVDRVQLPARRILNSFGPNGTVYLTWRAPGSPGPILEKYVLKGR